MKKQILFTAVMISGILFSCTKEKITQPEQQGTSDTQLSGPASMSGAKLNALSVGLEGWFRFDGSLQDATGKLTTVATGPIDPAAVYTQDRKGVANSAIEFNGRYLVYIANVPHTPTMSISAWVKYGSPSVAAPGKVFIRSQSDGPMFVQFNNLYYAYNNPAFNPFIVSGAIDDKWHHLVATIDGTNLKFYIDGNLISSIVSPDVEPDMLVYYMVGGSGVAGDYWQGTMDDLRIYSRTLTSKDVAALYHF